MARTLSPAEVRQILTELVHLLAERGEPAAVHVIGGAAVATRMIDTARDVTGA